MQVLSVDCGYLGLCRGFHFHTPFLASNHVFGVCHRCKSVACKESSESFLVTFCCRGDWRSRCLRRMWLDPAVVVFFYATDLTAADLLYSAQNHRGKTQGLASMSVPCICAFPACPFCRSFQHLQHPKDSLSSPLLPFLPFLPSTPFLSSKRLQER